MTAAEQLIRGKCAIIFPISALLLPQLSTAAITGGSRKDVVGFISSPPLLAPVKPSALPAITSVSSPCVRPASMYVNSRGGGLLKSAAAATDGGEHEKSGAVEALAAIRFCVRACFASFFVDAFTALLNSGASWHLTQLTWLQTVDLLDSLNIFNFGLGLWGVSKFYADAIESGMTIETVEELCKRMARIWTATAWVIVAVSAAMATKINTGMMAAGSSYVWPTGTAALAILGSIYITKKSAVDAAQAVQEDDGPTIGPDAERARKMGFLATRNMALCMGSFFLLSTVSIMTWLVQPGELLPKAISALDLITPVSISGLLVALNRNFLRAVVKVTRDRLGADINDEVYNDLSAAQKGFYNKIGYTLFFASAAKLLPFVIAAIKAAGFVVPSFAGDL